MRKRGYRPGDGFRFASVIILFIPCILYKIKFHPTARNVYLPVEGILEMIALFGGIYGGKLIYRFIVRKIGEERAARIDFKVFIITMAAVIIMPLSIIQKS